MFGGFTRTADMNDGCVVFRDCTVVYSMSWEGYYPPPHSKRIVDKGKAVMTKYS